MKITFPSRFHCLSRWLSCRTNALHYFSKFDFGNRGCPSKAKQSADGHSVTLAGAREDPRKRRDSALRGIQAALQEPAGHQRRHGGERRRGVHAPSGLLNAPPPLLFPFTLPGSPHNVRTEVVSRRWARSSFSRCDQAFAHRVFLTE